MGLQNILLSEVLTGNCLFLIQAWTSCQLVARVPAWMGTLTVSSSSPRGESVSSSHTADIITHHTTLASSRRWQLGFLAEQALYRSISHYMRQTHISLRLQLRAKPQLHTQIHMVCLTLWLMLTCSPGGAFWLMHKGLQPSCVDDCVVLRLHQSLDHPLPFGACFHTWCSSSGSFVLLDGDKIAALAAVYLRQLLAHAPPGTSDSVQMGVVQTAYANGASTRFLTEKLGLQVACTNTGETRAWVGGLLGSVSGKHVSWPPQTTRQGADLADPHITDWGQRWTLAT